MSLFPTFEVPQIADATSTAAFTYKPAYRFDMATGDFVVDGNGHAIVADEAEAWKEWCQKQLATERFAFLAYGTDIGIESEPVMAEQTFAAQQSALERTITECLLADPYKRTTRVDGFTHERRADSIYTTFTVTGQNDLAIQIDLKTEV